MKVESIFIKEFRAFNNCIIQLNILKIYRITPLKKRA